MQTYIGKNAPFAAGAAPNFTRSPDLPRGFPRVGNGLGGMPVLNLPVSIVTSSYSESTAGTTSHSIVLPTGIVRDDLILITIGFGYITASMPSTPSGWELETSVTLSTNWQFAVYSKRAEGNESGTTITFTTTVNGRGTRVATVLRNRRWNKSLSISTNTSTATTTVFAPSAITSNLYQPLVLWVGMNEYAVGSNTGTITIPNNTTLVNGTSNAIANQQSVCVGGRGVLTSPGNFTLSTSATLRACALGIAVPSYW